MEQYIKDYAIGYYNDDRAEVIRKLEKGEILSDCAASHFIIAYGNVVPESLIQWRRRLVDTCIDKEEMRQLAADMLDANPTGWTDEQALDVLARRFLDMVEDASCDTERDILWDMLRRCHPDVVPRMEELHIKDVDDNIWFSRFLDEAEIREAGQAPSD